MQLKYYLLLFIQGNMTSTKKCIPIKYLSFDQIPLNVMLYVMIYHEKLTCTQIS